MCYSSATVLLLRFRWWPSDACEPHSLALSAGCGNFRFTCPLDCGGGDGDGYGGGGGDGSVGDGGGGGGWSQVPHITEQFSFTI